MSDQLRQQKIKLFNGYSPAHLSSEPDLVIIGNALSRGNPEIEYVLERRFRYTSGPQWLYENILCQKQVLAVSGTHGKTTTTAILTWLLEAGGKNPGFLIGGMAGNFASSARLTDSEYFVIEADEYDTAFFDKRSKFVHYHPGVLIINNIEFDHADIFADLAAIRREFHQMIRIMPSTALILAHAGDAEIDKVLAQGCWSRLEWFAGMESKWQLTPCSVDFSEFHVLMDGNQVGQVNWPLIGQYNAENALAAIAAAVSIGIDAGAACRALTEFKNVKRRLELLGKVNDIAVYDDFAHHPTAIRLTLEALRKKIGKGRVIAILEPRSNTMKQGVHKDTLAQALKAADFSLVYQPPGLKWDINQYMSELGNKCEVKNNIDSIILKITTMAQPNDHIIIMSNGGFEGIHRKLIERLRQNT